MKKSRKYIALDIGASQGRCMVGAYDGAKIQLEEISRFENGYVRAGGRYYWDALNLFRNVKSGMAKAAATHGAEFAGIGVDTWGVDFALLDSRDEMLGNPLCYRDPRTEGIMEEVFGHVSREEIFLTTGLQFMRINTLFQLRAMALDKSPMLGAAKTFLMIPDLINFWLTGRKTCEYTNASNSQLLDVSTRQWAYPLLSALDIPASIFPELITAGEVLAPLDEDVRTEVGLGSVPVLATATADTAAAVCAVPARGKNFAYLSSGTWGLLGIETDRPILSPKVQQYNFGNEGGVFDTIRLLRNIVNLWLLQECRRIWTLEGPQDSWEELIRQARDAKPFLACVDPDSSVFLLSGHMPRAIQDYCKSTGQPVPEGKGQIIRVCLESLAFKYRHILDQLTDIRGEAPEVLHIIGGGARNALLCQFAANACGVPVIAGPVEATALGNILMQMVALGELSGSEQARTLVERSFPTQMFEPEDTARWEAQYQKAASLYSQPARS